ncbi:AAA ATPase protein [Fadolivirus algeromassiliense]|jgi:hypothetical protein|uniref:AAA ATPase protein n=1 Tax=Fadolivirus FV1/VV64 TaxID=3070911 RepID=A0A7D3QUY6_9VIRU|nr:AAA ATPase protein [Fadolivirus algeromassiliense]QKF94587.1 AAA ATPase protein [Fadolivirus FV1/VV64]
MLSQYLITLISAFVSLYLPFNDVATKVACSMAISQILIIISEKFYIGLFRDFNIMRYFFTNNYVVIKHDNPFYEKFIELIYKKYTSQLSGCQLYTEFGKYKMMIEELGSRELIDTYNYDNKTFKMRIKLGTAEKQTKSEKNNNDTEQTLTLKNIIISSSANMNIIEEYIQTLIKQCNEKTVNNLIIYKPYISTGKTRYIHWKCYSFKTNKTIKNTIVSDDVQKCFFDDINSFINNEEYYTYKGLSYKRGYLLYGEPGCGKTSLIKAIANEYNMPIFIIDLSVFENNNELNKVVNDINGLVVNKQRHMLVFEDVDRSKIFERNYYDRKITQDCILNILDGLDESYGRISILTTNNLEILKSMPSLVRPGRIDVSINVTYCTVKQIRQILNLYYEKEYDNINDKIIITPAKLIQIISLLKDDTKVIKMINKLVNFTKIDIEKYLNRFNKNNDNEPEEQTQKEIDNIQLQDQNDTQNNEKKKKPRHLIMLEKKTKELNKKKDDIEKLEKSFDIENEKLKLNLEKKRINLKLFEMNYKDYQEYCNKIEEEKKKTEENKNKQSGENITVGEIITF